MPAPIGPEYIPAAGAFLLALGTLYGNISKTKREAAQVSADVAERKIEAWEARWKAIVETLEARLSEAEENERVMYKKLVDMERKYEDCAGRLQAIERR